MTLLLLSSLALAQDSGDTCQATADVVINELFVNPPSTDAGFEWVELVSNETTSLAGWTLEWGTSSFNKSVTIDALDAEAWTHVVIGGASVDFAAWTSADFADIGNASNVDAIRLLRCDGTVSDQVLYGDGENTDGWLDEFGSEATLFAPGPGENDSLARAIDGADTNDDSADFCVEELPTGGIRNRENCAEPDTDDPPDTEQPGPCEPAFGPVINEFMPDPDGADEGNEFIELYNSGTGYVPLTGWTVEYGTSSFSKSVELEGSLESGGWFVLGESNVGGDQTASLGLGNAGSSGDALRLVDCEGNIVDTVVYGPDNSDGWVDESGEEATSLADKPGGGESLHRVLDGVDTDTPATDFCVLETPTPGAASACPICDVTGRDSVKVNELLSNPEGTDGNAEWVELVNLGDEEVSVEAWTVEAGKSSWASYTLPIGTVVPAGGYLVVAGEGYDGVADVVADGFDLGNATSSDDGVRLVDCEGAVVDTVLYGPEGFDAELEDDPGSAGTLAPEQDDDESIGRYPDGSDTDDHFADWSIYGTPSPGAANPAPGSSDTGIGGGDRPGGCCNRGGTDASRPGGGCATVPQAGFWVGLLLVGALMRRRQSVQRSR